MSRFIRILLFSLVVLTPLGCTEDGTDPMAPGNTAASLKAGPGIKVLSQNLYLGVDLDAIFAGDVATGFTQLATSNAFDAANPGNGPRRLFDIAWKIAAESPHLVGLQEVTTYEFEFADGSTSTLNFMEVIQGWLYYFYLNGWTPYLWTPLVNPLVTAPPVTVDLPTGPVTVVDHDDDAILVRSDVVMLAPPVHAVYDAYQLFDAFGFQIPYYRGYTAVTVEIDGQPLVFVNTHLEVQQFEDVQVRQTAELIAFMDAQSYPVIAVGDYNSAANSGAADPSPDSYRMLRDAGFADIWLRQPHSVDGLTCCQGGDLTNVESELIERLDLVLARWGSEGFGGQTEMEVFGDEPEDRISFTAVNPFTGDAFPLSLWPSDHAGVVATLWPAPGR